MYELIDGKKLSAQIRAKLKIENEKLKERKIFAKLAVILVGDDNASKVYVRNKSKACNEVGIEYEEKIGEAAFYGPKLDVQVRPAVGNEYTLSTCQLDFCLPAKFNLAYIDKDGAKKTPVVLHRAILGSIDRFMAYYLEETKGALPTWLAPVQVKILPITDKQLDYCKKVEQELLDKDIRVELDDRQEKVGYKIREAQMEKIPYMLIVGDKEIEVNAVGVRTRKDGDIGQMKVEEFISKIEEEIKNYTR